MFIINRFQQVILYIFLSYITNSFISLPAKAEISNINDCGYGYEEDSKITRNILLKELGISLQFPANYRAMRLTDGSVKIVNNGIYKAIVCYQKKSGYMLPDYGHYHYWLVKKSNENFLYSNIYDKVPGIDNVYIVWNKKPVDNSLEHEIKLRIKTKTGLIEIEKEAHDYDLQPFDDEYIKGKIRELVILAKNIKIL